MRRWELITRWLERRGCGRCAKVGRPPFHSRERATAGAGFVQVDLEPITGNPGADSLRAVWARAVPDEPWGVGV